MNSGLNDTGMIEARVGDVGAGRHGAWNLTWRENGQLASTLTACLMVSDDPDKPVGRGRVLLPKKGTGGTPGGTVTLRLR